MPILALALLIVILVIASVAIVPFSLVQRYRVGTSRQPARAWLAILNLVAISISTVLFLGGALVTNFWVPRSFVYSVAGLAAGGLLGFIGLWLTRWERSSSTMHFTPNRWLVLGITLLVSARILYSFWRAWWTSGMTEQPGSWLAAIGIAESLGAGGVVLGYYLVFWLGVFGRIRRRGRQA